MVVFKLDSKKYFVHSYNGVTLAVHELEPFFCPAVKAENWRFIASVGAELEYDELEVFDVSIHGKSLTELVQDLNFSRLIVNREGYCFLNTKDVVNPSFGLGYYRINDLFGWTKYGVSPVVSTIWNRCDMNTHKVCVNLVKEQIKLKKLGKQEKNLRREVNELKDEMEKQKNELDATTKKMEIALEDLSAERAYSKDLISVVSTLKDMILDLKKHSEVHEVVVL